MTSSGILSTTFKSHISINYIVNYLLDLFKKKKQKSKQTARKTVDSYGVWNMNNQNKVNFLQQTCYNGQKLNTLLIDTTFTSYTLKDDLKSECSNCILVIGDGKICSPVVDLLIL